MKPSFNTTGPCIPGKYYMLSPAARLGQVLDLIDEEKYFNVHAGHQTGKTTCAQWLVEHYNRGDRYACAWVDLEEAHEQPDLLAAMRVILGPAGGRVPDRQSRVSRGDPAGAEL